MGARLRFAANGEANLIGAGQNERANWIAGIVDRLRNFARAFVTQIPREQIQPGLCRNVFFRIVALPFFGSFFRFLFLAGERADDFSLRVQNLQLGWRLLLFLQAVVQNRAIRRILADGIAPRIEVAEPRAPPRARWEEMRFFGSARGPRLPQRTYIVKHPERAPVRGPDEIDTVNKHVVNRSAR